MLYYRLMTPLEHPTQAVDRVGGIIKIRNLPVIVYTVRIYRLYTVSRKKGPTLFCTQLLLIQTYRYNFWQQHPGGIAKLLL